LSPIQFNLLQGFNELKDIVTPDEYLNNLLVFFNLEKTGWAHLITIYGKTPIIKEGLRVYNFDEEILILNKYNQGDHLKSSDLKKLTEISLQLNASGYVFLRYILTHFEYINAYKTRNGQNNWHLDGPLFKKIEINLKEVKWNFEIKINSVFTQVDAYCNNMLNYFNETFIKKLNYNEYRYCISKYVFRDELPIENKHNSNVYSFYSTRLISSHIQYLETFRHLLLLKKELFDNIPVDKEIQDKFLSYEGAQIYLIEVILKYLNLNKMFNDPSTQYVSVLEKLSNDILISKNYEKWIKI
jgi:hypothetical protein